MKTSSLVLTLALAAAPALAAPAVKVEGAWARSAVAQQGATGAYMTLTASEPLTLLGAQSPAAGIVEIHQMKMVGEVMKMSAADQLPLAPGKPLQLKPGGYHFMLMDLKGPMSAGSQIQLTLRFRDAAGKEQTLPVQVPVAAAAPVRH
jgi:copper(I)-binding protein